MAPAVCPLKHKIILQDAAQFYVLNCGPAAINTTCYSEEAPFQRCFKIIRLRLQLTAFHGSLLAITNINIIFRTFTSLCKSQQSLCHLLPFYQCVTEFRCSEGSKTNLTANIPLSRTQNIPRLTSVPMVMMMEPEFLLSAPVCPFGVSERPQLQGDVR